MDLSHRLERRRQIIILLSQVSIRMDDCLGIHGAVDIFGWLQLAVWIIRAVDDGRRMMDDG